MTKHYIIDTKPWEIGDELVRRLGKPDYDEQFEITKDSTAASKRIEELIAAEPETFQDYSAAELQDMWQTAAHFPAKARYPYITWELHAACRWPDALEFILDNRRRPIKQVLAEWGQHIERVVGEVIAQAEGQAAGRSNRGHGARNSA